MLKIYIYPTGTSPNQRYYVVNVMHMAEGGPYFER